MTTHSPQTLSDPFDLSRFVVAQEESFHQALRELRQGRKESHWMWFIFPQIAGLGSSSTARFYAIQSVKEAQSYLAHPILGPRLAECCEAILARDGKSASAIFGCPDDLKLRSCMTLFAHVVGAQSKFMQVIGKYFSGCPDERTIGLLPPVPGSESRNP